jgi:hypothetical protein
LCEIRPFWIAGVLVARGFRPARPAGWAYDRNGLTSVVFVALALVTIPQALAFDLLFSHAMEGRIISAVVHLYAIGWSLALAYELNTRPHVIVDGHATFHFPLLQTIVVELANIQSVRYVMQRPRGIPRFGFGKAGLVVDLKAGTRIDRPMLGRSTSRIFVAADNVATLERALSGCNL